MEFQQRLRQSLFRFKRTTLVFAATLVATIGSLLIYLVAAFGNDLDIFEANGFGLWVSTLIPLILTPIVSWHFVGLSLHIHRLEEDVRRMATYDALTGVMGRRAFLSAAEQTFELAHRNNFDIAVLYIDIDHFKVVNDTYGHGGGDEVLRCFATVVEACVRKSDLIGRLGGEEFAVILLNTNQAGASVLAEKIRETAKASAVEFSGRQINYTVSVGLAMYVPERDASLDEVISKADEALYVAKHDGRDRVVIY